MFKIAVVVLAVLSAVLADTSFEASSNSARPYVAEKPGFTVSRPAGPLATAFAIPPDSGGNWGDNLWKSRASGDQLLSSEIQINGIANKEQKFNWQANFPGKSLTHIRFLNIGRQRAYVESVSGNGGPSATAVVKVSANQQFRLLIEVYGK